MDELRNFIQDNRDAFDDYELPAGHAGRFERKLMRRGKRRPIYLVASLLTAACVALFIFLVHRHAVTQVRIATMIFILNVAKCGACFN